ncbi:MAG TPA: ThuA domain-containing protein [Verrucomicrobiae bacterium]|nr:ThuA domain-containing protein [Verrucomicrobiae bacterium]
MKRHQKSSSGSSLITLLLSSVLTLAAVLAQAEPKRALVVSTTTAFRHESIPTAERILGEIGKSSGVFTVDYARVDVNDPKYKGANGRPDLAKYEPDVAAVLAEKMSASALKNYDLVIFANTTGDLPLPDKQAFLDWIKSGKGFVGIHSATDTFRGHKPLDPYIEMIGGEFKIHGPQVEVEAINQDPQCPACRHLPASWKVFDEIYQFNGFERAKVHGLLTLDKHPNNKTPGDYPIAWIKEYGNGRVFYTSLGHREDIWDPNWKEGKGERKNSPEVAKAYQEHLLGGIKWALGLEKSNARP